MVIVSGIMDSPLSPKRRRILASLNPIYEQEEREEEGGPRTTPKERSGRRRHGQRRGRSLSPPTRDHGHDKLDERLSDSEEMGPKVADHSSHAARGPADREEPSSRREPRVAKFRFKSGQSSPRSRHRRRHRGRDGETDARGDSDGEDERSSRHHQNRHRHRHDHRHHRRRHEDASTDKHKKAAGTPAATADDDPLEPQPMGADEAFRGALFNAMADRDEAAYWGSVYGQPLHIYGRPDDGYSYGDDGGGGRGVGGDGRPGTLEAMTDDEYAAYVRQKMWEKTREGLLEVREQRERAKNAQAARAEEEAAQAARATAEMEAALRRGDRRRQRRGWAARWAEYVDGWKAWDGSEDGVPWPGGYRGDGGGSGGGVRDEFDEAKTAAVREFFVRGIGLEEVGEREFLAQLKDERVRWHPDKIMQRLGGEVDEGLMRGVTAIFQIVDKLWNDTRKNI